MKNIEDKNLSKKNILVRVDLNVPVVNNQITDRSRIKSIIPTLNKLKDSNNKIFLISHFGRPKGIKNQKYSLKFICSILEEEINIKKIYFLKDFDEKNIRNMINDIKTDAQERMVKSIAAMVDAFKKIRTGRAHPSILEGVMVDYYGSPTPLAQLANINVEDGRCLAIVPWEKPLVPATLRVHELLAHRASDLQFGPLRGGRRIPLRTHSFRGTQFIENTENTGSEVFMKLSVYVKAKSPPAGADWVPFPENSFMKHCRHNCVLARNQRPTARRRSTDLVN